MNKKNISVLIILLLAGILYAWITLPHWYENIDTGRTYEGKVVFISDVLSRTYKYKDLKNICSQYVFVEVEVNNNVIELESHDGIKYDESSRDKKYAFDPEIQNYTLISQLKIGKNYRFRVNSAVLPLQHAQIISFEPLN